MTWSRSARTAARWCSSDRRARRGAGARLANPGEFTFRAYLNGRIDLVQAEAVARSDRRGHAAAGARGVRSARRHAHGAHPRVDGPRAVRSDRAARGVAGFSRRGLSLHRRRPQRPRELDAIAQRSTRCSPTRTRAADPRRSRTSRSSAARTPESRQLFNRLAGAGRAIVTDVPGHDARSADGGRRHRRDSVHARRYGRRRARAPAMRSKQKGIARARRRPRSRGARRSSCSIDRGR